MVKFVKESVEELKHKVSWPSYSELQRSSVLVLVGAVVFALVLFVIDQGFENVMTWFYNEINR